MPGVGDHAAGSGLFIEDRRDGADTTVVVVGEIDIDTGDRFEMALVDATRTGAVVRVDLGAVTFFSARGVSALMAALRTSLSAGGALTLSGASPAVHRVLELTDLADSMGVPTGGRPVLDSGGRHDSSGDD